VFIIIVDEEQKIITSGERRNSRIKTFAGRFQFCENERRA
jgi:hypothetical protein